MKVGLIGLGSIGERHLNNLKRRNADVVVYSKRKKIKNENIVHTWREFASAGPFEAIFITNETYKHLPTIKKCLALTGAFFVEKPLSHNSRGLNLLANQLKTKKISFWVGYCLHFFAPLVKIKTILKNKQLGHVFYLRVAAGGNLSEWRKRDYRQSYSADKKQGGGVMLDLVHDINYPAWLLDEPLRPRQSFVKKISKLSINAEDFAENLFITKSGTIVMVTEDYVRVPGRRALEIAGDKGSLTWDTVSNTINVQTNKGNFFKKNIADRNEMYEQEVDSFFKQMKKGYFSNINEAVRDIKNVEYLKKYARK